MPYGPTPPTLYHSFTIQTPAAWARARRLARLKRVAIAVATVIAFLVPSPLQHHSTRQPASSPTPAAGEVASTSNASTWTPTERIGMPVGPNHRGMRL